MRKLQAFKKLGKGNFVGIRNYKSSANEVSNIVINGNIDVLKAKQNDLAKLKAFNNFDFLADKFKVEVTDVVDALSELIASAEKNLNKDIAERSNQSKAQTEAYQSLGNGLKLHKDTFEVHLTGFVQSKTVLVEGTYKTVNSRVKTLIKKAIQKECKLQMLKFRSYKFGNIDSLKIEGSEIVL